MYVLKVCPPLYSFTHLRTMHLKQELMSLVMSAKPSGVPPLDTATTKTFEAKHRGKQRGKYISSVHRIDPESHCMLTKAVMILSLKINPESIYLYHLSII